MQIIYEDEQLLVVYKEAGLATQTARLGQPDLVSEVKNHIFRNLGDKNPYIGLINRLDQPVEGLVLFGKNAKVTARLNEYLQQNKIQKYYYALVYGMRSQNQEELIHYLEKDKKTNLSKVVREKSKDAKKACLEYQVLCERDGCQLVNIHLKTGRHHQIRVQFSVTGTPLVGDSKYGSQESISFGKLHKVVSPALCAYRLELPHPKDGKMMTFQIEPKHPMMGDIVNEL